MLQSYQPEQSSRVGPCSPTKARMRGRRWWEARSPPFGLTQRVRATITASVKVETHHGRPTWSADQYTLIASCPVKPEPVRSPGGSMSRVVLLVLCLFARASCTSGATEAYGERPGLTLTLAACAWASSTRTTRARPSTCGISRPNRSRRTRRAPRGGDHPAGRCRPRRAAPVGSPADRGDPPRRTVGESLPMDAAHLPRQHGRDPGLRRRAGDAQRRELFPRGRPATPSTSWCTTRAPNSTSWTHSLNCWK